LSAFGLSNGFVTTLRGYLTSRQTFVRISVTISTPFTVRFVASQGLFMEPLLINILSMTFEMLLNIIYVDDIAIFRVINSADDCTMIQFLIYCVQG